MGKSFPLTFIFFRGVETTNQDSLLFALVGLSLCPCLGWLNEMPAELMESDRYFR
jgi:hypothetical protein